LEGGPFFYSVEHFSVKVFTKENTSVLAGRWVKVEEGEGGKGGGGGGISGEHEVRRLAK